MRAEVDEYRGRPLSKMSQRWSISCVDLAVVVDVLVVVSRRFECLVSAECQDHIEDDGRHLYIHCGRAFLVNSFPMLRYGFGESLARRLGSRS